MKDMLKKNSFKEEPGELGELLTSWKYIPTRSNKFLFFILGILGGLVLFLIYYGENLIPWLKKLPAIFIYITLFLISPFLKYLSGLGKDQEWSLFKKGYIVRTVDKDKVTEEKTGWWKDFKSCTYDAKGVKLIPKTALQRPVRIFALQNTTAVYSICREQISIAYALEIEHDVKIPVKSRSSQQKYLDKMEKKLRNRDSQTR